MSSVLAFFLFYFHCFSFQFPQPNPLQNLSCSGWPAALQPRGEGVSSTAASLSARSRLLPRPLRVAASRCSSRAPPPRQRPRVSSVFGRPVPLRPAGDGDSSRGRSNRLSGAPGGGFQIVPSLRRPSQGLRFSRRIRSRAPDAVSTGGDNPGDAEAWVGLLLLKIASAGLCEVA